MTTLETINDHDPRLVPGTRIIYTNGGFSGVSMGATRDGDVIVCWDSHYGVQVDWAPLEMFRYLAPQL